MKRTQKSRATRRDFCVHGYFWYHANMTYEKIIELIQPWMQDHGIKILGILIVGLIIHKVGVKLVDRAIRRAVGKHEHQSVHEEKQREDTLIKIFNGTIHIATWLVAGFMILSEVGIDIAPLIAGAGVVGLALGFGGQYLIRDVITGLFIILENQYRVGDIVECAGISGKVEDISLRVTVMRDLDGVVHHIPHGEVTTVSNKSMGVSKINLNLGISYSDDIDKAIMVINTVGKEMFEDDYFKTLLREAPHFLRVDDLGDSAVVLKIVGETEPGSQYEAMGELRRRLKKACDASGIEIPFPQMTIHQKK